MEGREIRAALDHHWAASDANDFEAEHRIYREDAVLEYPQSGERNPRSAQRSGISFRPAEQETLHRAADTRRCRPLDH
jgi:ketosteroid isomerase-like protein